MLIGIDPRGYIAAFEARPDNAAHSMDTDWYAVDRDGHVAQLWSAEEGAVPWEAHRQYWAELYEELAMARIEVLLARPPGQHRQILELGGRDDHVESLAPGGLPYQWSGVLQFADPGYLALFRDEVYHAGWRVLEHLSNTVAVKDVIQTVFLDYWNAGAIVRAYVSGKPVKPRAIGLFEYACDFSGPYRRTAIPREPMLLDSLPAPLRGKLGALVVSKLNFHVTTDFDPADLFRCHTYR